MSHAVHQKPRRVLGDDCDECVERSKTIQGLAALDSHNMAKLAELATELKKEGRLLRPPDGISYSDMRAVANLRLAGRIVFKSGITEEVCK